MKFGGASLQNAERIRRVAAIIQQWSSEPLVIVISAIGKTTNLLDQIGRMAAQGEEEKIELLLDNLYSQHYKILEELSLQGEEFLVKEFNALITFARKTAEGILALQEYSLRQYARLVAIGELLSSKIVAAYLKQIGIDAQWVDIRNYLKTDDNYREARILFHETALRIQKNFFPLCAQYSLILTQGFLGSTLDNQTTTLGREGSDYTAAILASLLKAQEVILWKDVPGIMNCDPARYGGAFLLNELSYEEAAQMTFWGAKVIHPKTIAPLAQLSIPLQVRSFLTPQAPGTIIQKSSSLQQEILLYRQGQVMLSISYKGAQFMDTVTIKHIFDALVNSDLPIYSLQLEGLCLFIITEGSEAQLNHLKGLLDENLDCQIEKGFTLYSQLGGKNNFPPCGQDFVFMQKYSNHLRWVVKEDKGMMALEN
ncbi:MAG: aspartate kinase [Bacteroidia bacterium]|nr:aspartate kinase [Bacteroidia bacterium]